MSWCMLLCKPPFGLLRVVSVAATGSLVSSSKRIHRRVVLRAAGLSHELTAELPCRPRSQSRLPIGSIHDGPVFHHMASLSHRQQRNYRMRACGVPAE